MRYKEAKRVQNREKHSLKRKKQRTRGKKKRKKEHENKRTK